MTIVAGAGKATGATTIAEAIEVQGQFAGGIALVAAIAQVVVPVLAAAGLGYAWNRRSLPFDPLFVTAFVTNVATPCLIFSTLSRLPFPAAQLGEMALAALLCLGTAAALAALGLALARLPLRTFLPALIFPNTGNMGLPMSLFAFGDGGLGLAIVFFAVISVCQFTAGVMIAAGRADPAQLARTPLLYAVAAALAANFLNLPVPGWVQNTTTLLGNCAVPLMLVALGVALGRLHGSGGVRTVLLSASRLAIGLAAGWGVSAALDLDGVMRGVVILQSSMPVAVFNYLFAAQYGNRPEDVAGVVVGSTLMSFALSPVVLLLVM